MHIKIIELFSFLKPKILWISFILCLAPAALSQSSGSFITTEGAGFRHRGVEFRFFGFNAYYLQSAAADSSTHYIIDDVFSAADEMGAEVIRIPVFHEDSVVNVPGVIRTAPYTYREQGLKAVDYILAKADEYDIYLILTLSNNHKDFGGIPMYLHWADLFLDGSSHRHSHFFTSDSMNKWYKDYIDLITGRVNSYTGIEYKNDTLIFAWELMNEASNEGVSPGVITDWYSEMSAYLKEINPNHLVTTGEIGYDDFIHGYSDAALFYNNSSWLIDGFKGTSYIDNSALPDIDYCSLHSYPEAWGMDALAGITWIKDHYRLSENLNKPVLLSEFGMKHDRIRIYREWLGYTSSRNSRSAIVWHYMHPDVYNTDGYGFSRADTSLFSFFTEHVITLKGGGYDTEPSAAAGGTELYQNYPNPFNPVTTIEYYLSKDEYVEIAIFSVTGELIRKIVDEKQSNGYHRLILSMDSNYLASGIYIYRLKTSSTIKSRKFVILQ